eukprot:243933-Pyramimonas_sp.AAC.1
MANAGGQIAVRADGDTFKHTPLSPHQPHMYGEYPTAWISQKHTITEEESTGCMNVFTSLTRDQ